MPKVRNIASRRPGGARTASSAGTERPVTFRLDEDRLDLLTALAVLDETTVAEQIRLASESYIHARLEDPALRDRAEAAVERFRRDIAPVLEPNLATHASVPEPRRPSRDTNREKPVTLRLSTASATYFTSLAVLDGGTLADQLRAAVDRYVDERRQDPALETQIRKTRREHEELLSKLRHSA